MANYLNTVIKRDSGTVPTLDPIICRLTDPGPNPKAEVLDHVIVQLDRKTGKTQQFERKRFTLGGLFGSKKPVDYYRVDTYQHTAVNFSLQYRIEHEQYGLMELKLEHTIWAIEGSESLLIEELTRRNTPASMLNDRMHEWIVQGITENMEALYTNFGQFSGALSRYLTSRAAGIGLHLRTVCNYSGEPGTRQDTIRITARDVPVQPKGYNDFLTLGFDAVLIPDRSLKGTTLTVLGYKNREEFDDLLVNWLQQYIRETTSYNDILSALHFKVHTGIIGHWNKQLRALNKGWEVGELAMQTVASSPAVFKFEHLEVEVALRNGRIPLSNTIILNLEDAERFKNKRIDDLEKWVKEKLQQAAQNVLAKVSFAELVARIDQLTSIIKSDLDRQAQQIGYRVEVMLTSRLISQESLNFQMSFIDDEQVFQTSLNEKVQLNVMITGRIKSLDHDTWRNTLTPERQDFVMEMKKEVLRVVRQMLLRINPDDFYTQFNTQLEPKLVAALKDLLVHQFNVDYSVDIAPQMEISPIRQLIIDLLKGTHHAQVKCFNEAAEFQVTFSVSGIDPNKFSLFASRNYQDVPEVIRAIGDRIRIFVENAIRVKVPDINVLRDSRLFSLIEEFARRADAVAREKLGVIIDIIDVEQISNAITGMMEKNALEAVQERIRFLINEGFKVDQQLLEASISDESEWETENIKLLEAKKLKIKKKLEEEQFEEYQLSHKTARQNFDKALQEAGNLKEVTDADNPGPANNS
jgi:hypothetical protein